MRTFATMMPADQPADVFQQNCFSCIAKLAYVGIYHTQLNQELRSCLPLALLLELVQLLPRHAHVALAVFAGLSS